MILVHSGAFLSISSWFCELTELIFVMIPYISSTGCPPTTQRIMGHVQVANMSMGLHSEALWAVRAPLIMMIMAMTMTMTMTMAMTLTVTMTMTMTMIMIIITNVFIHHILCYIFQIIIKYSITS